MAGAFQQPTRATLSGEATVATVQHRPRGAVPGAQVREPGVAATQVKEPAVGGTKRKQEVKQEGGKKRKQEVKEPEAEVEQNEACWC